MSKLLIISTEKENWAVKQLIKKGEEAGLEIEILNPNKTVISLGEKILNGKNQDIGDLSGIDICLSRLSEENLEFKTTLLNQIENSGIKVVNTAEAMYKASNKIESQILLARSGLKTPKTVLLVDEDQLDNALAELSNKFPVIIKTITGTHGCGVIICDSKPSLKSMVSLLLKEEVKFMIQECIEHTESARILMMNSEPLVAVMRTVPENDFRSNAHLGAELKLHEPTEAEIDACKRSCEALNINLAAIDYIISGNDILILEVNGSPGFEAMQKVVELDIAKAIIDYCCSLIEPSSVDSVQEPEQEIAVQEPSPEVEMEPDQGIVDISISPEENLPVVQQVDPEGDSEKLNDIIDQIETSEEEPKDNIIGTTVHIIISHFSNENTQEARVDTGAKLCSINGSDIDVNEEAGYVKFKFDDTTYKFYLSRMIKIKQVADGSNPIRRPVIQLDMIINDVVVRNVECTINDRDHMKYSILLGRIALTAAGVLVDPSIDPLKSQEEE